MTTEPLEQTAMALAWLREGAGGAGEPPPAVDGAMPLVRSGTVLPDWVDSNGHMNSLMVTVALREGASLALAAGGFTRAYIGQSSVFLRESHVSYWRELRLGDAYDVRCWVAGVDERAVHTVAEMVHAGEGWRAASMEWLHSHVDLATRRSSPWPAPMRAAFDRMQAASTATLPRMLVGRAIATRGT